MALNKNFIQFLEEKLHENVTINVPNNLVSVRITTELEDDDNRLIRFRNAVAFYYKKIFGTQCHFE